LNRQQGPHSVVVAAYSVACGRSASCLEKADEFVACDAGLSENRAKGADRQIAVSVDGDDDKGGEIGVAQVVMASADVDDREASTLERTHDGLAAQAWERVQGVATSSSTSSASTSASGSGRPSLAAASR